MSVVSPRQAGVHAKQTAMAGSSVTRNRQEGRSQSRVSLRQPGFLQKANCNLMSVVSPQGAPEADCNARCQQCVYTVKVDPKAEADERGEERGHASLECTRATLNKIKINISLRALAPRRGGAQ